MSGKTQIAQIKMDGIIGRKMGMTEMFDEAEELIPITVIEAGPCPVVGVKREESEGYNALQLGFLDVSPRRLNKPLRGIFKKAGVSPKKVLKEFPVGDVESYKLGQLIDVSILSAGDRVNVTGRSKGRGFSGVVKRHGFGGGPKSHGQSDRTRAPGSIGASSFPSRVFKGTRMAGRMGNAKVTVKNLRVVEVDRERNLILVEGSVPGPRGGILFIRKCGT